MFYQPDSHDPITIRLIVTEEGVGMNWSKNFYILPLRISSLTFGMN